MWTHDHVVQCASSTQCSQMVPCSTLKNSSELSKQVFQLSKMFGWNLIIKNFPGKFLFSRRALYRLIKMSDNLRDCCLSRTFFHSFSITHKLSHACTHAHLLLLSHQCTPTFTHLLTHTHLDIKTETHAHAHAQAETNSENSSSCNRHHMSEFQTADRWGKTDTGKAKLKVRKSQRQAFIARQGKSVICY